MENFKLSSDIIVVPTVDETSHNAAKAVVLEKITGYKGVMLPVYDAGIAKYSAMQAMSPQDIIIALNDPSIPEGSNRKAVIDAVAIALAQNTIKRQAILELENEFYEEGIIAVDFYNKTIKNPADKTATPQEISINFTKTGRTEPQAIEFIESVVNYDKVASELISVQTDLKLADERKAIIETKFLKLPSEKLAILEKTCSALIASGMAIGNIVDEMNLLIGSTSSTSKTAVSVEAPEGMKSVPGTDMKFFAKIDKEVIANGAGQAAFITSLNEYYGIDIKLDNLQSWGDTQKRINKILVAANKPIPVYSVSIGKGIK